MPQEKELEIKKNGTVNAVKLHSQCFNREMQLSYTHN